MRDIRLSKLADVLVNYSTQIKKGDIVLISYSGDVPVFLIKEMKKNNFDIKAIIGVDGSPTCGVDRTALGGGVFDNDKGIFMKLLYKELEKNNINIPFIGARLKNRKEFEEFLKKVEKRIK